MVDIVKNFAYSTVATAPSPATTGTSLVVAAGDGAKFPAVPFNLTIWPAGALPTAANAEIVRVTAIATDTLTISRAQESTTARTVIIGDQIAQTFSARMQQELQLGVMNAVDHGGLAWTNDPITSSNFAPVAGSVYATLFRAAAAGVCNNIKMQCTTLSTTATALYVGIFDTSGNQLGISATAHVAFQTTGTKTIALLSAVTLVPGTKYVFGFLSVGGTSPTILTTIGGSNPSLGMTITTTTPMRQMKTASAALTAFANPEVWTGYAVVGNSPTALMTV